MKYLFNFIIILLVSICTFAVFFLFTLSFFTRSGMGLLVNGIPTLIILAGSYLIWRIEKKGYKKLALAHPLAILGCIMFVVGGTLLYLGMYNLFVQGKAHFMDVSVVSWNHELVRNTYYQVLGGSLLLLLVALSPYTITSFKYKASKHLA